MLIKKDMLARQCGSFLVSFLPTNIRTLLCVSFVKKTSIPAKHGNTSNLFHHLNRFHPLENAACRPSTSPQQTTHKQSTMERYSATVPYEKSSKRYNDITHAIVYYIAKEMQPFSVVEKSGFKRLLGVVDQRYRKYFTKTAIPQLYSECRQAVEKELSTISYFATTADIWTSST